MPLEFHVSSPVYLQNISYMCVAYSLHDRGQKLIYICMNL